MAAKQHHIFLDLYDTLIYIEHKQYPYKHIVEYFDQYNIPRSSIREQLMKQPQESIATFLTKNNIHPEQHKAFTEMLTQKFSAELDTIRLFPETIEVLRSLRRSYTLTLISNISSFFIPGFYKYDLQQYFDHVIFSCDVGYMKPEKEIYQLAMDHHQTSPQKVMMVGDNIISDYQGAINIGINAVHVDRKQKKTHTIQSLFEVEKIADVTF